MFPHSAFQKKPTSDSEDEEKMFEHDPATLIYPATRPVTTVPAGIELYSEQDVQEFYHWLDTQMVAPVLKNTLLPKQEKMFENEPATIVTEKTPGNNLVIILMSSIMTMMKKTSNDSPAADAKRYMDLNRLHLRAASRQFPSHFVT